MKMFSSVLAMATSVVWGRQFNPTAELRAGGRNLPCWVAAKASNAKGKQAQECSLQCLEN